MVGAVTPINTGMKFSEIIEGATGQKVWKATKATHDALRTYRRKQETAADAAESAKRLEPGPQKVARTKAAQAKAAEARRIYGDELSRANEKRADALSKNQP